MARYQITGSIIVLALAQKNKLKSHNLKSHFGLFVFEQQFQRCVKSICFETVHQERSFGQRRKFFQLRNEN